MTYQAPSARKNPRFTGIKTFFRLPHQTLEETKKGDYDVALFGVPFDSGASYRPGSRFAPMKVRELSSLGRGYHPHYAVNFMDKINVLDLGDSDVVPVDIVKSYESIQTFAKKILQGGEGGEATGKRAEENRHHRFIAVGGDHSITLPLLRATHEKYGEKLALIHFDAHFDTYPAAWGSEYHHGSFLRHAIQEGLVEPQACLQVGIRGPFNDHVDEGFVKEHGVTFVTTETLKRGGLQSFSDLLLSFQQKIASRPTYLTFDIDVLDPAYAPGTGTPVMGGLTSYEVQSLLRELKKSLPSMHLVAADLVEVSPPYDPSDITSLAAVGVLFEILHLFTR